MFRLLGLFHLVESVVDKVFYDNVYPLRGSVLYCDFIVAGALIQHSGIYVGKGKVVELSGKGIVEIVSIEEFNSGFLYASSIYVSCDRRSPVGCSRIADDAEMLVGAVYDYSVINFNCHKFVSGLILSESLYSSDDTEFIESIYSTLTGVKMLCRYNIKSNNWRVLDRCKRVITFNSRWS